MNNQTNANIFEINHLTKSFKSGQGYLEVLKGIDLQVKKGEILAILGPSGAGKSTLIHIMGLLDRPTTGTVLFQNQDLALLSATAQARMRNTTFGFVFQFYHLIPELSALDNVLLPYMITYSLTAWWDRKSELMTRARDLMTQLGLNERIDHKPTKLSGGEKQRVAIARALIHDPEVVFCDEPTGNLDKASGQEIQKLILKLNKERGKTFIIVTHDENIAQKAHRVIRLSDGKIVT
ncbi:MAG: ABC transporter ATP-binding protein [Planctomycetes bacterium]|nr:ABC transporter ATP-binding protein [Planctomycetota bacterium]